jgi:HEAT repeat protein
MVFFCPGCWAETQESDVVCATCGFNLTNYARLPYEEKLILALNHPIRESCMMAIRLLGDLKSNRAVATFEAMLETEEDFYLVREIVWSLQKIGTARSREIIQRLRYHPSGLVRRVVEESDEL